MGVCQNPKNKMVQTADLPKNIETEMNISHPALITLPLIFYQSPSNKSFLLVLNAVRKANKKSSLYY